MADYKELDDAAKHIARVVTNVTSLVAVTDWTPSFRR